MDEETYDFDLSAGCFDDMSDSEEMRPIPGEVSSVPAEVVTKSSWDFDVINSNRNDHLIATSLRDKILELYPGSIAMKVATESESSLVAQPDTVEGSDRDWGIFGLSKPLLKSIYDILQFKQPSQVQTDAIPIILTRRDVLVTAETGSGKTAAFLVPVCEHLLASQGVRGRRKDSTGNVFGGKAVTRCVILLPTRELAVQCHSMLLALTTFTTITSALVVGGSDVTQQASILRRQPDIVLATPGRLLDLALNYPGIYLDKVDMVVLDEADRLLEIGFKDEITNILKQTAKSRQSLLFSATVSAEVTSLMAAIEVRDPVLLEISKSHQLVAKLVQEFVKISDETFREAAMIALAKKGLPGRTIIFVKEKREAHRLAVLLGLAGVLCFELHGDLQQARRVSELTAFQRHTDCCLIATDLASRGLDLPSVNLVINYCLPQCDIETRYTHRVGRTARMGREGRALTIYTGDEYKTIKKLMKVCSHEEGTLFERKLATSELNIIKAEIGDKEEVVKGILSQEEIETQLIKAEREAEKAENLHKHRREISSKPERVWIDSANDKDKAARKSLGRERKQLENKKKTKKVDERFIGKSTANRPPKFTDTRKVSSHPKRFESDQPQAKSRRFDASKSEGKSRRFDASKAGDKPKRFDKSGGKPKRFGSDKSGDKPKRFDKAGGKPKSFRSDTSGEKTKRFDKAGGKPKSFRSDKSGEKTKRFDKAGGKPKSFGSDKGSSFKGKAAGGKSFGIQKKSFGKSKSRR